MEPDDLIFSGCHGLSGRTLRLYRTREGGVVSNLTMEMDRVWLWGREGDILQSFSFVGESEYLKGLPSLFGSHLHDMPHEVPGLIRRPGEDNWLRECLFVPRCDRE